MQVVFRTDASNKIGSGHVMRCLALAEELSSNGAKVTFVCREHQGNMCALIESSGHKVHRLPLKDPDLVTATSAGHDQWLGVPWSKDAEETAATLSKLAKPADWLVVDHYSIDRRWEIMLRPIVHRILVIDDLADRPHDCDVILDQNLHRGIATRYNNLVPSNCLRFLGPRYAILRPQFKKARNRLRQRNGTIRRVLIFFGGVDLGNETSKAFLGVQIAGDFLVDIILGPTCPHVSATANLVKDMPNVTLHIAPDNIASLMIAADIAIGAIGVSVWERSCLGLPSIVISTAANQISPAQALLDNGCIVYIGESNYVTADEIALSIKALVAEPSRVKNMSRACMGLTDGNGTNRLIRALDKENITLRAASIADCENVYEWRNSEQARRFSSNNALIPWHEHVCWFEKTLRDPQKNILIGERGGHPVGVLRLDIDQSECVISIYLTPDHHGNGYGPRLLQSAHNWLKNNRHSIQLVRAKVLTENLSSINAFLQAGYHQQDGHFFKHL